MVVLTHWKTAVCKLKVFDLNNDSKHLPNPHISDLFGLSLLLVSVVSGWWWFDRLKTFPRSTAYIWCWRLKDLFCFANFCQFAINYATRMGVCCTRSAFTYYCNCGNIAFDIHLPKNWKGRIAGKSYHTM